jgi:hypothetical protein
MGRIVSYQTPLRQLSIQGNRRAKCTLLSAIVGTKGRFHFLPVVQADPDEFLPRIIPVAGAYRDMTAALLRKPFSVGSSTNKGGFDYFFGEDSSGAVAVPGSALLNSAVDPVAVIASSDELGFASRRPTEVVMVVDRAQTTFCPDSFFLCNLPGHTNTLNLQRMDTPAPGTVLLAKVLLCFLPPKERGGADGGGFLENDDYF